MFFWQNDNKTVKQLFMYNSNQLTSSCQHHTIKIVTIIWKDKAELKCLWKEQFHIQLVHVHFVIKEEKRLILVLNEEWVPDEGIGLSASHLLQVTAPSCCFCSHLTKFMSKLKSFQILTDFFKKVCERTGWTLLLGFSSIFRQNFWPLMYVCDT